MFKDLKELLPDNKKTMLIVIGLVLLVISQALAQFSNLFLAILRYTLFVIAIALYFYVAISFHRERLRKKRARDTETDV